jgi:hypothetical protein
MMPARNPSGRTWRTRSLSVVIEYRQPIRSAITVAGAVGHSAKQQPKLVFHRIGKSHARASLTPRNLISAQRRPNRVPSNPQPAGDLFNRHALGPMQSADLRPILH